MGYRFFSYICYRIKRKRYVHSAFVYNFIVSVLKQKTDSSRRGEIKKIRNQLLKNKYNLPLIGLTENKAPLSASSTNLYAIAKRFSTSIKIGRILYNLVKHYHLRHIVEFGTSTGINTAYMAKAHDNV
ncbi:MAG: hypothetical protein LBL13_01765, partial [Bacteroidales bacterium]|nr:hypothetical protein [Bacteroidales bacterium]